MDDLKTQEAAAISAALLPARLAKLRFDRDPSAPVLPLMRYLHASAARLLLVPTVDEASRQAIEQAMAVHASDALVVHAAGRSADDITFRVVVRTPTLAPFWSESMRLWLGAGAPAHLVPDMPGDTAFALLRVGLRACEVPPWDDEADREAGLQLGRAELARVLGER